MAPFSISSFAHRWLIRGLWTTFALGGMVSLAMALSMLLDSRLAETGLSSLKVGFKVPVDIITDLAKFNFSTLRPTQYLYDRGQSLVDIPGVTFTDIQPIQSSLPSIVGSAASEVEAVQSTVSSELWTIATDAAAAIQSDVAATVPKNMSLGLEKLCLGWENETINCYLLPLNLSSMIPGTLDDILGDPVQQLQEIEDSLVTTILKTVRRSLMAGIVLLLAFSLILLFWEFPNELWRRAIMAPLGITCLMVPFLISTVVLFVVQTGIKNKLASNSYISAENGDASTLGLIGLIFSAVTFAAAVGITML
jgi:hypothetical protein